MSWITFVKIKTIGDYISSFIFALKIHFYVKIKIRDIISNGIDLDKCYFEYDLKQYLRV